VIKRFDTFLKTFKSPLGRKLYLGLPLLVEEHPIGHGELVLLLAAAIADLLLRHIWILRVCWGTIMTAFLNPFFLDLLICRRFL
jgi:hypothetical protein